MKAKNIEGLHFCNILTKTFDKNVTLFELNFKNNLA